MKRTYIILIAALASMAYFIEACKKESMPSHVAQISYPVITLQGAPAITINRGATWSDPGATWKDTVTGESGNITVPVNTSKDSAYLLLYTAKNKNGFTSSVSRGLAVTNYSGTTDISGGYTDNAGNSDTLQLVSRAFYFDPNIDLYGDGGFIAIKSDSTISVAAIETSATSSGTGSLVPEYFKIASINYSIPITIMYTDSINYQPVPTTVTLVHQ